MCESCNPSVLVKFHLNFEERHATFTHVPCGETIIKNFCSVFIILLRKVVYDNPHPTIRYRSEMCVGVFEGGSRAALQCKVKAHSDCYTCADASDRNMRFLPEGSVQSMKIKNAVCGNLER